MLVHFLLNFSDGVRQENNSFHFIFKINWIKARGKKTLKRQTPGNLVPRHLKKKVRHFFEIKVLKTYFLNIFFSYFKNQWCD